jgi:hypothetical protein
MSSGAMRPAISFEITGVGEFGSIDCAKANAQSSTANVAASIKRRPPDFSLRAIKGISLRSPGKLVRRRV